MKDKVINQIIKNLIPLRTLYPEIDIITNDLLIDKLDSLEDFLDKEFKDINYSNDLKYLITSLTEENILPKTYLKVIQDDIKNTKLGTIYPYNYQNAVLFGFKPLNVKLNNLETIKINISKGINIQDINILGSDIIHTKLTPINDYEFKEINQEDESHDKLTPLDNNNNDDVNYQDINNNPKLTPPVDDEVLSLEDTQIEKLRKIILNAQLNYLNNATSFIEELEKKDDDEIYQTLLSLNDIRYIHHSISKLSIETLNRLLIYVQELLKENSHNSLNIFIEEAIKKILHDNK